jgi:hypothetical protein
VKKRQLPLPWGTPEGKDLLQELVAKLEVDIFATNQLSWNYDQLGISYEALKTIKAGGLPVSGRIAMKRRMTPFSRPGVA